MQSFHHGALNPSKPTAKTTDPTPATKRTTKSKSNSKSNTPSKNICEKLDLTNLLIPELPDKLDNYVPAGIEPPSISHIFQNSAGDLIAIDRKNHKYYITSFPGLNIKRMYEFPISADTEINSVFQTYSGATFLFFDNDLYIQFIEHPQQLVSRGRISDVFPGIRKDITSAFQYIDGLIYFFSHRTYYKYNEFTKTISEAGQFGWNLFGIPCPIKDVFNDSSLSNKLASDSLAIPKPRPLPARSKPVPFVIVADDVFAMKPYIMKPYAFGNRHGEQRIFNCRMSRAHNVLMTRSNKLYAPHGSFDVEDYENGTIQPGEWRQYIQGLINLQNNPNLRGNLEAKNLHNISTRKEKFHSHLPRQYRFNIRKDFAFLTDNEFNERFRLNRCQLENLLRDIGPRLANTTVRWYGLTPPQKTLIALHWLGNGGQYHGVCDMHGVSKMTVCRCVHDTVNAVNEIKFDEIVSWPHNMFDVVQRFYAIAGFPEVCGAVDGTLLTIDAPRINEPAYVDRHGKHSINCMAVCGPDLTFYYVSANWPGSVHDARVLRNSSLFRRMENGWRPHPNGIFDLQGELFLFYSRYIFCRYIVSSNSFSFSCKQTYYIKLALSQ
nr:unnamed protein product [Callosobruchus analis]